MNKKIIMFMISSIILCLSWIMISNYNATNVLEEYEIKSVLQSYLGAGDDIQIIDKKIDRNELFIIYRDEKTKIALGILQEMPISFGKYYRESGGSKGGLVGDYNFSQGLEHGKDILLVAYGVVSELEDNRYWVIFDGDIKEVLVDEEDEYFLDVYRYRSDKYDSWGKIIYNSNSDMLSKITSHNNILPTSSAFSIIKTEGN